MRKSVFKTFMVWQMKQEERWLNEKADKGLLMVETGKFHYEFEEAEPGKYLIKLLMLSGSKNSAKNRDYFKFLEEMGIEYVCGMNFPGVCQVYLKMEKENAPADGEIFSDIDSKIKYNRLVMTYLTFAAIVFGLISAWTWSRTFRYYSSTKTVYGILTGICIAIVVAALFNVGRLLLDNHNMKKERSIHE